MISGPDESIGLLELLEHRSFGTGDRLLTKVSGRLVEAAQYRAMEGPLPELSTLLSCMVGVGERVLHLGGRAFASGHTSGAKEASSRTRYGVFGNCGSWS